MKKGRIIAALCVVVVAVAVFVFFRSMKIIPEKYAVGSRDEYAEDTLVLDSVSYGNIDITENVDEGSFIEILSRYKCRRSFGNPFPYPIDETGWHIVLIHNNDFYRIVLGAEKNFMYFSKNDLFIYKIINPEALAAELEALI